MRQNVQSRVANYARGQGYFGAKNASKQERRIPRPYAPDTEHFVALGLR